MAAYYAGLHKKLKDNSVPILDRVKLARFGWVSNQCFLPNKHQVLLDWVCFRLANSEKDGNSEADDQSLWLFLHDALKSQEMHLIQREGKPIILRGNLCGALLSTLSKENVSDIVIGCCYMILTNEKLRFVQNIKFDSFVAMTHAFLKIAIKQAHESTTPDGTLFKVTGKALEICASLLSQQQNGKKAYGLTSEQLILPCLNLHTIISSDHHGNELCSAYLNSLSNSVKGLLFSRNMMEAYRTYLMSEEGNKHKTDGRVWADVVHKFMEYIKSKSGEPSIVRGLPVIYSAFITSFKPNPSLTFAMLQKLCELMSFIADDELSDSKICTMEVLLKLATSHKCYAATEEEAERAKKLEWFKKIVTRLLANKRRHPAWYGCLHIIFSLDHNTLATRMQEVWPCLLATSVNTPDIASKYDDVSVLSVEEARDAFLKSIVETYSKLRQMDRLLKVLLSSILTKEDFATSVQLPRSFFTSFGSAVESLTPGSTVALWDVIVQDISTNHIPAIIDHVTETSDHPPASKKKKKANKQLSGKNSEIVARFEVVASVLHTFLVNSKMVDTAEVGQVKGQVLKLLNTMAEDILKPLLGHYSHESQNLACSTLLLCYGWGELHLLLRQHTNLLERLPLPTLNTPLKDGDVHYLHAYSSASDWLGVMSPSSAAENGKLGLLKHMLLWQQARALVLHGDLEQLTVKDSLRSCLHQALDLGVIWSKTNSASWNGLIIHVQSSNTYTAHLTSLLHQSLTLLTFMDEEMHSALASLVCQAVCGPSQLEDGTNEQDVCSARSVGLDFLGSEACRESRPMQSAVVKAVADRLYGLNKSLEPAVKGKDKKGSKQTKMTSQSGLLNDSVKVRMQLLEILRHLPLLQLSNENQMHCMLGLMSLDTWAKTNFNMTILPAKGPHDLLELSAETRRLMAAILKGSLGDEVLRNKEINSWFLSFLIELVTLPSQEDPRVMTDFKYNQLSEGLMSLWLKKMTWASHSMKVFRDYLKLFRHHIAQCLKKLQPSKNLAFFPGVSTLLSVGVTLLNQCKLACRHKTPGTESKELLGIASDVHLSVFQLLGCILALTGKPDQNQQLPGVLRPARTLLTSLESSRTPKTHAADDEDESSDDGDSNPTNATSPHFKTCYKRALSAFSAELKTDKQDCALLVSCVEYLATYCSIVRDPHEAKEVWTKIHAVPTLKMRSGISSLSNQLEGLLIITLGVMKTDDLLSVLRQMLSDMMAEDAAENVVAVMQAWQLLPMATLSDESYAVVVEMAPQVVKQCQTLLRKNVTTQPPDGALIIALLSTVSKFISQGKDFLAADHAIPTMHLCLMVPWKHIQASQFLLCFAAVFRILNDLLMCYPMSITKAVSAYISCVNHLLMALIERCSLQTSETMRVDDQDLVTCAQNMQRLLSLIASLKEDISQYGIYLVADYISGLQKTTLPLPVKTPLIGGIYKIVDVCDEKTLALLNVTLPVSLKEVFRSFYADYKKHHKYTGHV